MNKPHAAKWLKITRQDLGFTQRQAAGLAGIHAQTLWLAEHGTLSEKTIGLLAEAYGLTVESLLS